MQNPQGYDEVIERFTACGYEVIPNPPGYIVRHGSDPNDASQARHLDDLIDLAELFELAALRSPHGTTK